MVLNRTFLLCKFLLQNHSLFLVLATCTYWMLMMDMNVHTCICTLYNVYYVEPTWVGFCVLYMTAYLIISVSDLMILLKFLLYFKLCGFTCWCLFTLILLTFWKCWIIKQTCVPCTLNMEFSSHFHNNSIERFQGMFYTIIYTNS